MRAHIRRCTLMVFWLILGSLVASEAQSYVRAKVGLRRQAAGQSVWAKSTDTAQAGDLLRLYVIPEADAQVYVIYTDTEKVMLLHQPSQTHPGGVPVLFPSETEWYRIDGTSPAEQFIILCSPAKLPEVDNLFASSHVTYAQWGIVEQRLLAQSTIDLSQRADKPFTIAGVVRSGDTETQQLLKELRIFSGQSLVVRKYAFTVKK